MSGLVARFTRWSTEPGAVRGVLFAVPMFAAGLSPVVWVWVFGWWGVPFTVAGVIGLLMMLNMHELVTRVAVDAAGELARRDL